MGERPGCEIQISEEQCTFLQKNGESEKVEVYKVKNYQSLMRDLRSYFPKQGADQIKNQISFLLKKLKI